MKVYIVNAISINMNNGKDVAVVQQKVPLERAKWYLTAAEKVESYVGHPDTARVISGLLGCEIPANRGNFSWEMLDHDDEVIVAQYTGPRLPEGATSLPEGADISFWAVFPVMGDGLFQMFEACAREGADLRA
jgi:hypothetical protein